MSPVTETLFQIASVAVICLCLFKALLLGLDYSYKTHKRKTEGKWDAIRKGTADTTKHPILRLVK